MRRQLLLFVAVYVIFHVSLLPSVPGGDSGELLGNSCTMGISHPPGYPLFSLLSYIAGMVTFIPRMYLSSDDLSWSWFGWSGFFRLEIDSNPTYAWKVNHMCAVMASFTVVMIDQCSCYISQLLNGDNDGVAGDHRSNAASPAAIVGALLFAFSPLAWEYASQSAEVFALNNFICAAILLFVCKVTIHVAKYDDTIASEREQAEKEFFNYEQKKPDCKLNLNCCTLILRYIYLGALFSGFAFANQHASLIFLVILVPSVVAVAWGALAAQKRLSAMFMGSFLAFLAGASPYVLQVYLARAFPTRGSWGDLSDWRGIVRHIFRAEYGTFRLGGHRENVESFAERVWLYYQHINAETKYLALPLLLVSVLVFCWQSLNQGSLNQGPCDLPTGGIKAAAAPDASLMIKKKLKTVESPVVVRGGTPPKQKKGKGAKGKQQQLTKKNGKGAPLTSSAGETDMDSVFKEEESTEGKEKSNGDTTGNPNNNTETKETVVSQGVRARYLGRSIRNKHYGSILYRIFLGTWLFYVVIWHSVLSNLPLDSPMPYIVHARFWIQPHILVCVLAGVGASQLSMYLQNIISSMSLQNAFECAMIVSLYSYMLRERYSIMDRSKSGWIMHKYGEAILDSLPRNSLLLSHTDLDWNPTRYLRECEHYRTDTYELEKGGGLKETRPDVTHLNFQMIAYPWFKKMQAPLYPHVVLPRVDFAGISTEKMSEGNVILITNTVVGNGANMYTPASLRNVDGDQDLRHPTLLKNKARIPHAFTGGIYLDMQGIYDADIEEGGKWRGLTLLPWGVLYRVLGDMEIRDMEPLHLAAFDQFVKLQQKLGPFSYDSDAVKDEAGKSSILFEQYPDGTWEFAALSVYNDAQMQLGLNLLTYAIEVQKKAELDLLPILLDRLHTASHLLSSAHIMTKKYGCISSGKKDLHKNTAMAWMRLQGILGIALNFKDSISALVRTQPEVLANILPHNVNMLDEVVTSEGYSNTLVEATEIIRSFVNEYPDDQDRVAFQSTLESMATAYAKLHPASKQNDAGSEASTTVDGTDGTLSARSQKGEKKSRKSKKGR